MNEFENKLWSVFMEAPPRAYITEAWNDTFKIEMDKEGWLRKSCNECKDYKSRCQGNPACEDRTRCPRGGPGSGHCDRRSQCETLKEYMKRIAREKGMKAFNWLKRSVGLEGGGDGGDLFDLLGRHATSALRDQSEETLNAVCRCGSGVKYKDCCNECPGRYGDGNNLRCHNASEGDHGITGIGRCKMSCRDVARKFRDHPNPRCNHAAAFENCCNVKNHYDGYRGLRRPRALCNETPMGSKPHGIHHWSSSP